MRTLERIVLSADFRGDCRRALEYAVLLAGPYDAEVDVVHARPGVERMGTMPLAPWSSTTPDAEAVGTDVEIVMRDYLTVLKRSGLTRVRGQIEDCDPVEALARVVGGRRCDLVVVTGGPRPRGLARLWSGDPWQKALGFSSCPLLVVGGRGGVP